MMQNNIWNKQAVSITQDKAWKQKAFEEINGTNISIIQTNSFK